ncbi:hypothetical protein ATE84_2121 [Aquimarina sp. MAR_2010_214]|uniref:FKBP-type peptidyl-prolyl cis-trans isomerase n=1 Tax=Aquimarina sp. MAR_2010_214 TaxID=1250026 RepID=UPI000C705924|nr:hypothetical protein [Aquimarina sp. MAR_2010_214]PKV50072.1 hypothetical protein ATE84_2121 [Aquimarina sp. MAR_2010_214]
MNVIKYCCAVVLALVVLYACKKDDDDGGAAVVPPRDRGEQQITDDAALQDYLRTHFYTLEDVFVNNDATAEYQATKFDTIAGANSGEQSILDSPLLTTKKITRSDVEYTLYVLNLNKGEGEHNPTFADSTLVTYKGELLYKPKSSDKVFDSAINPVWFDLGSPAGGAIEGFRESLVDFEGALNFVQNSDGSVTYTGYGNLVVFMPSGLAYFNEPRSGIPTYSPLIFNIQLYKVNQTDHDRDGLPSYLEDIDGDRIVLDSDDDTDGDNTPNYIDNDDDRDGTLTKDEITVNDSNNDGFITPDEITYYDDDGDGIKNHLDADDRDLKNE